MRSRSHSRILDANLWFRVPPPHPQPDEKTEQTKGLRFGLGRTLHYSPALMLLLVLGLLIHSSYYIDAFPKPPHHISDDIHPELDCPRSRRLSSTSSFANFIDATLSALDQASREITGNERPIEFLVENYGQYPSIKNGFWAEFGVFKGTTLRLAQDGLSNETTFGGPIAGFDSFQGLPEKWRAGFKKGQFGNNPNLYAEVRDSLSPQVELYKGWFQNTIPIFRTKHSGVPAALIHHDGDLFSSTTITLQLLNDCIKPGTHMIFDELIGYPEFDNHEILALWLWMKQRGATLCAMGHKGLIDSNSSAWKEPKTNQHWKKQSAWFQVLDIE
ncbi:hypothetical protein ACHAXR_003185 [Thalassiosira sp. AJA248-18]